MSGDLELTACYVPDGQNAQEAQPVIVLSDLYKSEVGGVHKVCANVTRSIPEGYRLIEHGVLWARGVTGLNEDNFNMSNNLVKQMSGSGTALNGSMYVNVWVGSDNTVVSLRGYMILENLNTGRIITVYSPNIKSNSYGSI